MVHIIIMQSLQTNLKAVAADVLCTYYRTLLIDYNMYPQPYKIFTNAKRNNRLVLVLSELFENQSLTSHHDHDAAAWYNQIMGNGIMMVFNRSVMAS